MKMWLIADSGGTSTTWVYGDEKIRGTFKTASLHPRNVSFFPMEDSRKLAEFAAQNAIGEFHFYGAGMSNPKNVDLMESFLAQMGFTNFQIRTDALAAGLACCGNDHGFTAILGTGSILIEMNEGEMVNRTGGLGPELGDEGSGYYFSKLLLDHLESDENWTQELTGLFGSKKAFQLKYNKSASPSELAGLAGLTTGIDLAELHRINLEKFVETHLKPIKTSNKVLNVVGSYGYYQKAILEQVLEQSDWRLNNCMEDPIAALVNRMFKNN